MSVGSNPIASTEVDMRSIETIADSDIIKASENCVSDAQAAESLGINYKTYKKYATKLGVFRTNQGGKGTSKIKSREHHINDNCFSTLNSETAYWIGYIAADGSVVENKLKFVIAEKDRDQLERFNAFANSDYNINEHTASYVYNGNKHYRKALNMNITSPKIAVDLSKYGIIQNKTYIQSDYLKNIPYEYRIDFIIGLFDGDGSISILKNKRFSITIATNIASANDIINTLNDLGINCRFKERNNVFGIIYIEDVKSTYLFIAIYLNKYKKYGTMKRKYDIASKALEN